MKVIKCVIKCQMRVSQKLKYCMPYRVTHSLKNRASAEEMRAKANVNFSNSPSAILVNNEEVPKPTQPPTSGLTGPLTDINIPQPQKMSYSQGPVY